jgi:hypothetical protein
MILDRFDDMFTYGLKVLLFATAVSHVIYFLGATALTQHGQTKKLMNIRKLTYSIDPSVSWSEPL